MSEIAGVNDLALSVIIFLSALGGALFGIVAYQLMEAKDDISTNGQPFRGHIVGHSSGSASGCEIFCSGESWVVFPMDSKGQRMGSDRYARKD